MVLAFMPPYPGSLAQGAQRIATTTTPAQATPASPYLQRGEAVEARYQTYSARLEDLYTALHAALMEDAPDLVEQLKEKPKRAITYGYQLVPQLIPDQPSSKKDPRESLISYSWPRTERMLDRARAKLEPLETLLQAVALKPPTARRPMYEQIVEQYLQRAKRQRLIERHIRHNRFWQADIHRNKRGYDRATRLLDAVLERQKLRDALEGNPPPDNSQALIARKRALTETINTLNAPRDRLTPAPFLTVLRPQPNLWIVQVPLYSDIQDHEFLQACKDAIERIWHVKESDAELRIRILLKPLTPQDLYRPDQPPATGDHLNLNAHVARFPSDGGVLTTGGYQKYAYTRRYVALGPQDITTTVLAHEFGHILGFGDGYFRAYRDLGADGYEVMELVPNMTDIMMAPGKGHVLRAHFDRLLAALSPASAAESAFSP